VARPLTLAAALGACALAACGGSSDDSSARPDAPAQSDPASEPAAQGAQRRGRLRLVSVGRFNAPLYVTAPPGDTRRVFVVEQGGTIRVVRGGKELSQPFLDISGQVVSGGEQGLLGLAFAPDYARSGLFYVNYTNSSGDTRIVEYKRASADRADAGSARDLLAQEQPEENHNGGQLAVGPDGLLYIGLGDGGGANDQHGERGNAQDLGSLLGKILRIDPRARNGKPYSVPSSNPFVNRAGARPEVYAYGLRNPWRFSFDRRTGDLTIGDVGQDAREEVDFTRRGRARGANFGWRPFEGNRRNFDEPAPGARRPALDYGRADGSCSVTGGYVVRDRAVPSLYGRYVYGDFCRGQLYRVTLRADGARNRRALSLPRIESLSSFGEDARGRVYVTSLGGTVSRFAQ
jgi:glucose/arabinose dehydrogenase